MTPIQRKMQIYRRINGMTNADKWATWQLIAGQLNEVSVDAVRDHYYNTISQKKIKDAVN